MRSAGSHLHCSEARAGAGKTWYWRQIDRFECDIPRTKKNPIQPRNWIGQVRHAPRKAPLEEKRMLTFAAFRSSLRPYTTFQSTSFYAALRVASHCGAEFHLALQSQGLLRHQRGTKHAREQDRQRHQRRDNVQGILVRTGGLPHAGKQHGTT